MRSRCGGRLSLIQAGAQRLIAGVQGSSAGSRSVLARRRFAGTPIRAGRGGSPVSQSLPPEAGRVMVPASARLVSAADRRSRVAHEPAQAGSARSHSAQNC